MPDAKDLAGQRPQPAAKRGVVTLVGNAQHLARIDIIGDANGRNRIGVERGALRHQRQPPGGNTSPHAFRESVVASIHSVEAFSPASVKRLA